MPESRFSRFGKYEIQAELGRGGFGTVFRAFDPTVGRLVAIKILTSEAGTDLLTRFRNEATAAGNLRHENIVTIYEFGEDNGMPFIAMEYLEGEDLQQTLASGRPLALFDKIRIMTQAAAGLDHAHRYGVVHRDVKPANIRLLPDGSVKIMDFGIARLIRDAAGNRLTRQGHVFGTLLYMAPEQVMGSDSDALSDIFSFGTTFYELLTGHHPFQAADPRSVFYKITSEDPPPIHDLVPDHPEALDNVIRRALHKDRELRYQTLRDLQLDVEPVLIELRKERSINQVTKASRLVTEGDFEAASALLYEAIDLDPANRAARQLRDAVQVELRRRLLRPRIEALLTKADQSLAEGEYAEAIQTLEAALRLDPEDQALQARSREAQEQAAQQREAALRQEVESVCRETRSYLDNDDFERALETVDTKLRTMSSEQQLNELRETVIAARRDFEQRATAKLTVSTAHAVTDEVPIASPPPFAIQITEPVPASRPRRFRKAILTSAAGFIALATVLIGVRALRPRPSEMVSIHESEKAGVQISRASLPASLAISSNFASGKVYLDEKPVGDLQDGKFKLDEVQPGLHNVRITSPNSEASLSFKIGTAGLPELNSEVSARDADAVVITSLGPSVRVTCSRCDGTVLVDGKSLEGAAIGNGSHELTTHTSAGQTQRALFQTSEAPAIAIHLSATVKAERLVARGRKEDSLRTVLPPRPKPMETVPVDQTPPRLDPVPQPQTPQPQTAQPSAEDIERREWTDARSKDRAAIEAFLQRHPHTSRRVEAQQRLSELEWDALDQKDRTALERFADRYRGTPLAQQATSEVARIDRQAAAAAAREKAEEQIAADRAEISKALTIYATAFERKDLNLLKTVWPNMPEAALAQAFRSSGEIRSQLRPLAPAEIIGDRATVRCTRITEQVTRFGRQKPVEEPKTVRLRRGNGRLVIYAID